MTAPVRPSVKLYRVLVVGGIAMAGPGCGTSSPGPAPVDAAAVDAAHAAPDAAPVGNDAAMMEAMDAAAACLNRPGDCTHGMCAW